MNVTVGHPYDPERLRRLGDTIAKLADCNRDILTRPLWGQFAHLNQLLHRQATLAEAITVPAEEVTIE